MTKNDNKRGVGVLSYRAMSSQVKKLESKIGISRRKKEEALGRLLDDLLATVKPPKNVSENVNNVNCGSKEDLPIAIELCEKYDIATKITAALKGDKE